MPAADCSSSQSRGVLNNVTGIWTPPSRRCASADTRCARRTSPACPRWGTPTSTVIYEPRDNLAAAEVRVVEEDLAADNTRTRAARRITG
jgi:hypothetical protein